MSGVDRVAKNDPRKLSRETKDALAKEILAIKAANTPRPWDTMARPKQLAPDHPKHHVPDAQGYSCGCEGPSPDWTTWVFLAGRGTGKTKAGANWSIAMALSEPGIYVAVCAPTFADVRDVCFEGQSGIIREAQPGEIVDYNKNNLRITMRNGSIIQGYSAIKKDSIRGANLSYCWFDELAMIPYQSFYDYGLKPALRVKPKNNEPRLMVTTTPKRMRLIRQLIKQGGEEPGRVHITSARSEENPFFAAGALAELRKQYKGTYLEKQELEGDLPDEVDGALFKVEDFCEYRVEPGEEPEFRRIVVSIDPATTSSDASDETGIIVAAQGLNYHYYTLEDCSLRGTPDDCMTAVASAFRRWEADIVVGEKNGVGDYMRELLAKKDPNIPFKPVPAMKGKHIRAQPVSIMASQGRIHMVGDDFEKLEEQLTAMTPDDDRSQAHDDRADAWVWAMRELTGESGASYKEMYGFVSCNSCGEDVNETLDKACRHCGTPIDKGEKEKVRDRSSRWASAYQKTCSLGHTYAMNLSRCPVCNPDPLAYLAQVAKLSGNNNSGWSYTGKSWLQGRKI